MVAKVRKVVMPDAAATNLTGHVLNFINVIVYLKNRASYKFLLHYCKGCINGAGLMSIILSLQWIGHYHMFM